MPNGAPVSVRCGGCGEEVTGAGRKARSVRLEVYLSADVLAKLDRCRGLVPRATFVRAALLEKLT